MIIRKAMYGCGLYFFIKLAYNSPILCKFAALQDNIVIKHKYFWYEKNHEMRVWHRRHTRIFYFFKISHSLRIPSLAPH